MCKLSSQGGQASRGRTCVRQRDRWPPYESGPGGCHLDNQEAASAAPCEDALEEVLPEDKVHDEFCAISCCERPPPGHARMHRPAEAPSQTVGPHSSGWSGQEEAGGRRRAARVGNLSATKLETEVEAEGSAVWGARGEASGVDPDPRSSAWPLLRPRLLAGAAGLRYYLSPMSAAGLFSLIANPSPTRNVPRHGMSASTRSGSCSAASEISPGKLALPADSAAAEGLTRRRRNGETQREGSTRATTTAASLRQKVNRKYRVG